MHCIFIIGVVFMSLLHLHQSQGADNNGLHVITSPRYPKTYPKGATAINPISSSNSSMRIKLTVSELNLPAGDTLYLYDDDECGEIWFSGEPFRELTGSYEFEEDIFAETGRVCLKLSSKVGRGLYKIFWSEFPTCEGTLVGSSGDVISPEYPYKNYPAGKTCKWDVIVPKGQRIQFTVEDLDIKASNKRCTDDRLEIKGTSRKVVICGAVESGTSYTTTSNTAELLFVAKSRWTGDTARGFWLKYKAVGCLPLADKFGTAVIKSTHYTVRQKVHFRCPEGQIFQSGLREHIRICQEDNQWQNSNDTCVDITCSPPAITHGVVMQPVLDAYPIDSQVIFSCDAGLSLVGSGTIICTAIGDWNTSTPTCPALKSCPILSEPNNGRLLSVDTEIGGHAEYACDIGYKLDGNDKVTCQANGAWDSAPPLCSQITCSLTVTEGSHLVIEQMDGESLNQSVAVYGSRVVYVCEPGFALSNDSKSRQCGEAGMWDGEEPTCKKVQCLKPSIPLHGFCRVDKLDPDSEAHFGCHEGYTLVGPSNVTCLDNGTWSAAPPICIAIPTSTSATRPVSTNSVISTTYTSISSTASASAISTTSAISIGTTSATSIGTTSATSIGTTSATVTTGTSSADGTTSTNSATSTNGATSATSVSGITSTNSATSTNGATSATSVSGITSTNSATSTTVENTSQTQTKAMSESSVLPDSVTTTTYFTSSHKTKRNLTNTHGGNKDDSTLGAMKSDNTGRDIGIGVAVFAVVVLVVTMIYFILKKRRASPGVDKPQETFENPTYNIDTNRKGASNVELGDIK